MSFMNWSTSLADDQVLVMLELVNLIDRAGRTGPDGNALNSNPIVMSELVRFTWCASIASTLSPEIKDVG